MNAAHEAAFAATVALLGDLEQSLDWFHHARIAEHRNRTAPELIAEGRLPVVLDHLARLRASLGH